tara:strand:+ start:482 stop:790 length:309 start_codon:yes stop_codon:yes gene_type:complete
MARLNLVISPSSPTGELVPFTAEEEVKRDAHIKQWDDAAPIRAFAALREERNKKIAETDWRFRSDQTPSQDWIDYSQTLRDLPAQYTDETIVGDITWPTEPE